jgi:hypothetical protein
MSLPTGSDSSHFYFLRSHYLCKYKNGILDDSYLDVASMSPYELFFPDSIIGYMSASSSGKISLIFKTTDGGANWDTVYYSPLRNIGKMYFVDPNIGYALCDSGKMIKTINGGANWQNLSLGTTTKLHSVFFINDSVGFAAGDSGVIIRTTNGGQNWSKDITGITTSFTKIFFVSDSIGFALTGQTLYVTNLNWHTGIWEIYDNSKKQINIYPNPNEGKCDITVPNDFLQEKNLVLSIYDNTGRLIQQTKVEMNEDKIKLNLEAEAKGIYQVTLSDKTKTYSGKIIFE